MTIINDTRVVRLQRTAARTGHQHSGDERIVEEVIGEIVTAADVTALPPGSLITLQRGPGAGHTEEGSVLNVPRDEIGGVEGGQTTSVSFDSEDAGVTAAAIFQVERDYTQSLGSPGEYSVNYKTFQIKTYTTVPTILGQRILITYSWAPIREFLKWAPEDLYPDLEAFGVGPHQGGGGDAYESYTVKVSGEDLLPGFLTEKLEPGHGISFSIQEAGGDERLLISSDIRLDGYAFDSTVSEHYHQHSDAIETIIKALDGYSEGAAGVAHLRKHGVDSDDYPFDSVFTLDGYSYPVGKDRLLVYINGITQSPVFDYIERSTTSIEFVEQVEHNDIIDIWILPGALASEANNISLQNAYDNSPSGFKDISVNDGQITFTQTEITGSALRLKSNQSITPTLVAEQSGAGEAIRMKSVDGAASTILIQKDTVARNTIVNTAIIERSTSHISGSQAGIGSSILTRLENSGTALFSASRLVTGTESATDSAERTYFAIELSDDGTIEEKVRVSGNGSVGINTIVPDAMLHVQGDGYFSSGLEIAGQIKVHNTPCAPVNVPVLNDVPAVINDGDVWFSDIGGTRKISIRINGVTYSAILAV